MRTCPVCSHVISDSVALGDARQLTCEVCGTFKVVGSAEATLPNLLERPHASILLSHWLRSAQESGKEPVLNSALIENLLSKLQLPTPIRQGENLVLWLARAAPLPGDLIELFPPVAQAVMGAATLEGYAFVLRHLFTQGYLEGDRPRPDRTTDRVRVGLSFMGWEYLESLRHGRSDSRTIFMAMKFGDARLDAVFRDTFKPAVERAGLDLFRLDQDPKAGMIDDRIRVEIRRSVMLIADLTESNPGAYWESGFAEGLGKPVLFTCDGRFFRGEPPYESAGKTHFDTNHFYTVIWEPDKAEAAGKELTAAIRVTLPHLAKMEDV